MTWVALYLMIGAAIGVLLSHNFLSGVQGEPCWRSTFRNPATAIAAVILAVTWLFIVIGWAVRAAFIAIEDWIDLD